MKKLKPIVIILSTLVLLLGVMIIITFMDSNNLKEQLSEKSNEYELKNKELESMLTDLTEAEEEIKNLRDENMLLKESTDDVDSQKDVLENWSAFYEEQYLTIEELLKNQVSIITNNYSTDDLLPIYSVDIEDYSLYINHYILFEDSDEKIIDNLNLIASSLSKYKFRNLPLAVVGIENINGSKIANIDISETDDFKISADIFIDSWIQKFFQGSTGGLVTVNTLIESFLQNDKKIDNWIDGVRFTYEGESGFIGDHIEGLFEDVFYRNDN